MKYIILLNKGHSQINNHGSVSKQPLKVDGETLLQRTIRLLMYYDPEGDIIVATDGQASKIEGTAQYPIEQSDLALGRFPHSLIKSNSCFLYQEVYYTNAAIDRITSSRTSSIRFFGTTEQIFAIQIANADLMKKHINRIKTLYSHGDIKEYDDWQLYSSFLGVPTDEKNIGKNLILIDDDTRALVNATDCKQFEVALKRKRAEARRKRTLQKFIRGIRDFVLKVFAFFLVIKGCTTTQAVQWIRRVYRDIRRNENASLRQKTWAYRRGFLPIQVETNSITKDNLKTFISERDYRRLVPINGKYDKWLNNTILRSYIFAPFSEYFSNYYYQISNRHGERRITALPGCPGDKGDTIQDVLNLIVEKGAVQASLRSETRQGVRKQYELSYDGQCFWIDDMESDITGVEKFLLDRKLPVLLIIEKLETFSEPLILMQLLVINIDSRKPTISDAFILRQQAAGSGDDSDANDSNDETRIRINTDTGEYLCGEQREIAPYYQEIKELILTMLLTVPIIEFMGATIAINNDGFKITNLTARPLYGEKYSFSETTTSYLLAKLMEIKKARKGAWKKLGFIFHHLKLRIRRRFTRILYPKSLLPYLGVRWISMLTNDLFVNRNSTLAQKLWAYRNGYLSYRIEQYGITKENRLEYISDFEYLWLRHINSRNRIWFEDKLTFKYMLSEYNECFPEYYFHVVQKNGKNEIISLMDCPEGYSGSFEDILRLVAEKKVLALKPDEGSHGKGFFKFSYDEGRYYLNSEIASKEQIEALLSDAKNQYLVTEYIQMHTELKRIYDGSVNTIRIIVFKKDGKTPEIGNTYMRIGSSKTGAVDNMVAGGMYAQIDTDTGHYFNAKAIAKNEIVPCEYHPDTGARIDGILPNWEKAKELVLAIAQAIPQLEYFGFDVAITEDGIKIPEINRYPDFPKIEPLSPRTIDYLLYKLEMKKARYGYNKKRPVRIFSLPKRPFTEINDFEKEQAALDSDEIEDDSLENV